MFNILSFHIKHCSILMILKLQVFIPCELNHQWFVIVANFNKKSFDVLSSDYRKDNYLQLVNTVIYNFKCLFMTSFPTFKQFNIRDFEPSYLEVPKQTFKYVPQNFFSNLLWYPYLYIKCCFVPMQI
jgi:hypothetical protein